MNLRVKSSVRRRLAIGALIVLLGYVGSYAILSRRGMAHSKAMGAEGLYFFPPEDTDSWRAWNYGCVIFYYPLIAIETWLGTVDGVGSEPLWRLSQNRTGQLDGTPLVLNGQYAAASPKPPEGGALCGFPPVGSPSLRELASP